MLYQLGVYAPPELHEELMGYLSYVKLQIARYHFKWRGSNSHEEHSFLVVRHLRRLRNRAEGDEQPLKELAVRILGLVNHLSIQLDSLKENVEWTEADELISGYLDAIILNSIFWYVRLDLSYRFRWLN